MFLKEVNVITRWIVSGPSSLLKLVATGHSCLLQDMDSTPKVETNSVCYTIYL